MSLKFYLRVFRLHLFIINKEVHRFVRQVDGIWSKTPLDGFWSIWPRHQGQVPWTWSRKGLHQQLNSWVTGFRPSCKWAEVPILVKVWTANRIVAKWLIMYFVSTTTPFRCKKIKVYTFDAKRPMHCNFENSLKSFKLRSNFCLFVNSTTTK